MLMKMMSHFAILRGYLASKFQASTGITEGNLTLPAKKAAAKRGPLSSFQRRGKRKNLSQHSAKQDKNLS